MGNHATKGFSSAEYELISILHPCNLNGNLIIAQKGIISKNKDLQLEICSA